MYTKYLEKAVAWARAAGEIQLDMFRRPSLEQHTKQNLFDVVTKADKESERLIVNNILESFPDHSILAEESGRSGAEDSEWLWVIDPLDGTTNYSQGLPAFCVSIALRHKGVTVVGVVYAPYLGEMFSAMKGEGAFLNGRRIRVSGKHELPTMVLATGMPYDKGVCPDNNLREISALAPRVRGIRRMGSAAIDLCYTAAGFFDAYWELNLNPWDVEAGALMVTEAGGVVVPIREDRNVSVAAGSRKSLDEVLNFLKR